MLKSKPERAIAALRAEPKSEPRFVRREVEAEEMGSEVFNARFDDALYAQYEAARNTIERAEHEIRKARRVIDELSDYTWAMRGDEEAVNWGDPSVRADYLGRFAVWLEAHPAIFCQWQAAGLCFDDLFEKS